MAPNISTDTDALTLHDRGILPRRRLPVVGPFIGCVHRVSNGTQKGPLSASKRDPGVSACAGSP